MADSNKHPMTTGDGGFSEVTNPTKDARLWVYNDAGSGSVDRWTTTENQVRAVRDHGSLYAADVSTNQVLTSTSSWELVTQFTTAGLAVGKVGEAVVSGAGAVVLAHSANAFGRAHVGSVMFEGAIVQT